MAERARSIETQLNKYQSIYDYSSRESKTIAEKAKVAYAADKSNPVWERLGGDAERYNIAAAFAAKVIRTFNALYTGYQQAEGVANVQVVLLPHIMAAAKGLNNEELSGQITAIQDRTSQLSPALHALERDIGTLTRADTSLRSSYLNSIAEAAEKESLTTRGLEATVQALGPQPQQLGQRERQRI